MPRLPFRSSLLAITLLTAALGTAALGSDLRAQVESYRSSHEAQIVGALDELTRLKSVAADPAGINAAANYLLAALERRGFDARLLSDGAGSPPLVFGELKSAGARHTVMFYAHYDGQPVTPSQWNSDPFLPLMRSGSMGANAREIDWRHARAPFDPEWRLYGRAASDDKASIVAFLSAFDALQAGHRHPSIDIKVAWEGEEETGSPHLARILARNQALLTSDAWLIGDGPVHQSGRQMIYFGARGVVG